MLAYMSTERSIALCQLLYFYCYAKCYVFCYAKCYMSIAVPSAICLMLCQLPSQMLYFNCYMSSAISSSMTTSFVGHSLYISVDQLCLSIWPLLRRTCYQIILASLHISNHHLFWFAVISWHRTISLITVYFGLSTYHGIAPYHKSPFILVCQHIMASCNKLNHRLSRLAY
jgi:hypothetical protein